MNFIPALVTKQMIDRVRIMLLTVIALFLAIVMSTAAPPQPGALPDGWYKSGSAPDNYDIGTDDAVRRSGSASAYVKARVPDPEGFATMMQAISAEEYRGKRVRLTGYIRAVNAREAGLWLRVDGANPTAARRPLAFDNTQARVRPGNDWTRADIVLDVPADAAVVNFGLLLVGPGQVWVDDLDFSVVRTDVPITGDGRPRLPASPRNLDFERKPTRPPTTHDVPRS